VHAAHDLGGAQGFGRVVSDGAIFHADWEARLFALTEVASVAGITSGHFREAIEAMTPSAYLAASYYERWLFGLERRLQRAGTVTAEDVDAAMTRLGSDAMPVRRNPALAERCLESLRDGGSLPPAAAPRFGPGERVRVRRMRPTGHTRCPGYVRGAIGVVQRVHGDDRLADAVARGEEAPPEALYAVRFRSADLFGHGAEAPFHVFVDLADSYLEEPA
jgi:nitrile hydratase beta subunit